MNNEKSIYQPKSPEDLRALAEEWRAQPCHDWSYSLLSLLDAARQMQKLIEMRHDRYRIAVMGGAYIGECLRRDRRLRGTWIKCDDGDCPDRAACPGWAVQVVEGEKPDCVFGFVGYVKPYRERVETGGFVVVDLDELCK
jgi:hypothetical protein